METLFRYVPFRLKKKKISVSFFFFQILFRFVSIPFRKNMESVPVHFVPFQTVPFRINSVSFVPFLLNVLGFPFRTVSFRSNLFRFVLFPDNIYRYLFPSVAFPKFCLSCCSDATCHIQHS